MAVQPKLLQFGAIVRAQVCDPNGRNWKLRPLVVISQSITWDADEKLPMVCLTSTFDSKDQKFVELPSDHRGHPATQLRIACAAACHWLRFLDSYDVESVRGYVPESYMEMIIRRVRALNRVTLSLPPGRLADMLRTERQMDTKPPFDKG